MKNSVSDKCRELSAVSEFARKTGHNTSHQLQKIEFENIKFISFDAADTLFFIKNGLGATYAEKAAKYGFNTKPDKIKRVFSRVFASAPPLAFGDMTEAERKRREKQWWHCVVSNVFNETGMLTDFDRYFEDLFEHFRKKAWKAFPDSASVLGKLKRMGYEIILISNFDSRVYDVLEYLELGKFFSSFTISSEAGFSKPSPEIFQIALKKQGVNPGECLHIGDDMEKDYIGAKNAGINSVLLDRENGNTDNVASIRTLEEIIPPLADTQRETSQ